MAGNVFAATQENRTRWEAIPLSSPQPIQALNTPALLLDLDAMEANLRKMAEHMKGRNMGLRPHTKTHKCPIIAKKQLELGAVGVCAAKVSEAEVMVDAGIDSVLITSPVVTPEKISRVIALTQKASNIQIVVDNEKTATDFHDAAKAAGVVQPVLVGLDTGTRRTGIALGKPALRLVEHVHKLDGLAFGGLQAYAGHLMHVKGHGKRNARSQETLAKCLETKALVEKNGFDVSVFTGGGTGTFDIDSEIEGMTDIQCGSYPFMDAQYRDIGDRDGEVFDYFEPSLYVLVTAISQPVENMITVDGGYKAFASDHKAPAFSEDVGLVYHWGGDEHGICQIVKDDANVKLGDKIPLMAPHCDPTVNLYDYFHPHRNAQVEEIWPIPARGHSQ